MNKLYTLEISMKILDPEGMELTSELARFQGPSLGFIQRVMTTCPEEMVWDTIENALNAMEATTEELRFCGGSWEDAKQFADECVSKCDPNCCSCPSI